MLDFPEFSSLFTPLFIVPRSPNVRNRFSFLLIPKHLNLFHWILNKRSSKDDCGWSGLGGAEALRKISGWKIDFSAMTDELFVVEWERECEGTGAGGGSKQFIWILLLKWHKFFSNLYCGWGKTYKPSSHRRYYNIVLTRKTLEHTLIKLDYKNYYKNQSKRRKIIFMVVEREMSGVAVGGDCFQIDIITFSRYWLT